MEFKAQKKIVKVTIDDQVYDCSMPTVFLLRQFNKKLNNNNEKLDELDVSIEFLKDLGLPIKAIEQLDPEDFSELIKIFTGSKKKS